jgi:hypothetical protein
MASVWVVEFVWQAALVPVSLASCQIALLLPEFSYAPWAPRQRAVALGLRLVAVPWCVATAAFLVMSTMAQIQFHGMEGVTVPSPCGSLAMGGEGSRSCLGDNPFALNLPGLALMTALVGGQALGAALLMARRRRS